jgi:hypothetical protein
MRRRPPWRESERAGPPATPSRPRRTGAPASSYRGNIDHTGLRLITCGGDFDHHAGSYVDNIVVYATFLGRR